MEKQIFLDFFWALKLLYTYMGIFENLFFRDGTNFDCLTASSSVEGVKKLPLLAFSSSVDPNSQNEVCGIKIMPLIPYTTEDPEQTF